MPGTDQSGYAGFTDQVNNHYLRDVRDRRADESDQRGPDGRTDGGLRRRWTLRAYGYYQPNQWAMAGETAGSRRRRRSAALGQQMMGTDEPSADNRDPARLPIQRDGDRGPGVSGTVQGLRDETRIVHIETDYEGERWEF